MLLWVNPIYGHLWHIVVKSFYGNLLMYKYYVTEWGNGMMVNIILDCNMDWIIPPFPTFSTSKFFLVSDLRGVKGDLMKIL